MTAAQKQQEQNDLPYYERPDPKVPLTMRVPRSVREGLEDVVRLWQEKGLADGDITSADEIDLTLVATRLLRLGIEGAFGEYSGRPTDEEGWSKLIKAIKSNAKK